MRSKLEIAFELDRRWRLLRGEMDGSKRAALIELALILAESRVPCATIGGMALQILQSGPRTTIDIDLAVLARDQIPRERLRKAGFRLKGTFANSENWIGPEQTPVQFTDDATLAAAIEEAAGSRGRARPRRGRPGAPGPIDGCRKEDPRSRSLNTRQRAGGGS